MECKSLDKFEYLNSKCEVLLFPEERINCFPFDTTTTTTTKPTTTTTKTKTTTTKTTKTKTSTRKFCKMKAVPIINWFMPFANQRFRLKKLCKLVTVIELPPPKYPPFTTIRARII